PERVYPLLDIYVQASFYGEGTSNSILEAMAHGLPVVATDVGGNREVVIDGETGSVVPRRSAYCLAQAVLTLLLDAELRRRMGKEGLRRVRTVFSLESMVTATEQVYESALRRAGEGRRRRPLHAEGDALAGG